MIVVSDVLSGLLAAMFLFSGYRKLRVGEPLVAEADHLRIPVPAYRLIGVPEMLGAAGLIAGIWWPVLGMAAAAGLLLLLVGAIGSHLRVRDTLPRMLPALVLTIPTVAVLAVRPLSA
ncbi:DoxX family protein [Microbacterium protaetiae]|nr:DoxX family protein [Microbacterium protaetiae]